MAWLTQYWFIALPVGMEVLSFLTMAALSKWVYPRLLAQSRAEQRDNEEEVLDEEIEWQHMDDAGRPQGPYAWARVVELLIIIYHFPVIVPTAYVRKDNSVPAWVMYALTPVLYSVVLYFLIGRHQAGPHA